MKPRLHLAMLTAALLSCVENTFSQEVDLPRGWIVQVGGTCPKTSEGRLIHYLLPGPAGVEAARRVYRDEPLVQVARLEGGRLPHAENTVRHLICAVPDAVDADEALRVLRPLGTARIRTAEGWREIAKPWPVEIDEWTHWLHGAGSNPVAADKKVGLPRRMLWTATPRRSRSHEKGPSLIGMVSARGRLFYISDEGPVSLGGRFPDKWRLVARDAFSGALLWKRPVPDWGWEAWSPTRPMNFRWGNPRFIHRRLVAVGDCVYVTLGYSAQVSVLDADTGDEIRVLNGTENTCEIVHHRDLLVLSVATEPKDSTTSSPPLSIVVIDPKTGRTRWRSPSLDSLADLSERGKKDVLKQGRLMIAADEDRVVGVTVDAIVAYDFASGKEVWRVKRPSLPSPGKGKKKERQSTRGIPPIGTHNIGMLIVNRGRVYFGQPHGQGKVSNLIPMTLVCLQAANGKKLWRKEVSDWTYTTSLNAYAVGETLVVHGSGKPPSVQVLDAATGKLLKEHDISAVNSQHHHRCYRNKATENYILMGKEGVEYLDIRTGKVTVNRWIRGACLYGILPANGLLYTTPEACACNQMNRLDGFNALAADAPAPQAVHPFTRGPAYGTAGEPLPPYAWPQYRRDVLRSGATDLKPGTGGKWQVKLSGPLTAPVSDGARLFLGCNRDVLALDVANGKVLWRAPGPIDSPPTLHRELLLYGTRDGWIHCRRADDGELAWRFRAAPEERLILDDDRIESVWPLHGSLLLFQGRVYAVAGRSTFLDGGLRLFALHPETGKVEASSVFRTEQTRQVDYYEGVTNDVLVTDGKSIFLKHMKIDPKTLAIHRQAWWQFSGPDGKLKSYAKPSFALPVQAERTPVLSAASGFLDDELFGRAHVQLDGAEFCNRLCFDEKRAYGIRHSRGPGHFQFRVPGKEGFPVLCFERKSTKAKPKVDARTRRRQKSAGSVPADYRVLWRHKLPLRPSALLAAGDHLYLGGGPDEVDPNDPLASSEWRAGGLLYVLLRADGTTVARQELSAPPVHEGILPLPAGLFLVLRDGTVMRH